MSSYEPKWPRMDLELKGNAGRYLRLALDGRQFLHLDEVELLVDRPSHQTAAITGE